MCKECGCGQVSGESSGTGVHDHSHHHDHHHDHDHEHGHSHHAHSDDIEVESHVQDQAQQKGSGEGRRIDLERKVLAKNEEFAQANREYLDSAGVRAFNFISSPGTGKTLLLEKLLERLNGRVSCAVIVGDQQTDRDAQRLSGKGARVKQIETGNTCHLDAERIHLVLDDVIEKETKLLLIENVGNLICPAAFSLGEDEKIALLSVTEGEDKPLKYPTVFSAAQIVILTKADLVPHLEWDMSACLENLQRIAPNARVFVTSAKTGQGLDELVDFFVGSVC